MMYESCIGKDLEGSSRGLIKVQSQHLPGGTEKNQKNLSQDSQCPGQNSKYAPPKHKSRVLPLYQHIWYEHISFLSKIYKMKQRPMAKF
jgi:hypothetical protein